MNLESNRDKLGDRYKLRDTVYDAPLLRTILDTYYNERRTANSMYFGSYQIACANFVLLL